MLNRKKIKFFISFILRMLGLCLFSREVIFRDKNVILCYHDPHPEVFRKHLKYLVKKYNIISLDSLVNAIAQKQKAILPPKSLVITIDDGWKGNYNLLEVIKEFDIPVTIFLNSGIVNTNRKFWWQAGFAGFEKLKLCSNTERLAILKEKTGYEQKKEYDKPQALDLREINEMDKYVSFQSHGCFHPVLTKCSDKECLEEIKTSKELLENILKRKILHFAYPNGDYGQREMDYLRQFGYASGVSLDAGWNDFNSNPFSLKRVWIDDEASIHELSAAAGGIFGCSRYFLRKISKIL